MSSPVAASRATGLFLAVAASGIAPAAHASGWGTPDYPENDVALGPALAFAYGPDAGYALGFDTAYTYGLFAASVNLKSEGCEVRPRAFPTKRQPRVEPRAIRSKCRWSGTRPIS